MLIQEQMSLEEKLAVLSDAAKYDVSCTSSGVDRKGKKGMIGNAVSAGLCHSFAADGRCISLLKILFTNQCIYDCRYCINRRSNDVMRTAFTPDEVCTLTMEFYRRNYIEGLFLSSGILHSPDYTMDLIYQALRKLRVQYRFNGYIHVKAIPGADPVIIEHVGLLADRMSVNLELPTAQGLKSLAPSKSRSRILAPMRQIQRGISTQRTEIIPYKRGQRFVPAGQSTQMIVGATPENDYQMIKRMSELEPEFKLDAPHLKLLTIGRLDHQKGYDIALEAARLLKERGILFTWYVLRKGGLYDEIKQTIQKYGLEKEFILLGITANPYPMIKQCDIYVQTSKFEGYGLAIAEARMLNKPVVTTKFDAVFNQMVHEKNGLVTTMDGVGVADGIERLLKEPDLYHAIVDYLNQEKKGNVEEIAYFYQLIEKGTGRS